MSTLVIAEKPSVARDLAQVLGATRTREGYLEGEGYRVTWAIGHLVALPEPHEVEPGWKKWSWGTLPMLPGTWPLKVLAKTRDQYKVVQGLLRDRDTRLVVAATDAGREGELIFRYLYEKAGARAPVKRLWISSLTPAAIRAGFARLRDGAELEPLADAAKGRSRADWLVGMNLSRAYSLAHGETLSVGRVQTPTLAMLVEREEAIRSFVPEDYLEVHATFDAGRGAYPGVWFRDRTEAEKKVDGESGPVTRLPADGAEAQAILQRAEAARGRPDGARVARVDAETKRMPPPLLYDLTELQRHVNRLYGYSAKKTLELAQTLYERHKILSYPRTDGRHLSTEAAAELPKVVAVMSGPYAGKLAPGTGVAPLSKRYVDDAEVGDHHAIIPTVIPPNLERLSRDEARIYDLVCRRLLQAWHDEHRWRVTTVETVIEAGPEADRYRSSGRSVEQEGWKVLDPPSPRGDTQDVLLPPGLAAGQPAEVVEAKLERKQTRPPKPHTDATLLGAMESAGRAVEDRELSRAMRECGLGTPATRAAIIETLIQRGYVEREKKALRATDKGIRLVGLVDPEVKSPALTGAWEQRLERIAQGGQGLAGFMADIEAFVRRLVEEVAATPPGRAVGSRLEATGGGRGERKGEGRARTAGADAVHGPASGPTKRAHARPSAPDEGRSRSGRSMEDAPAQRVADLSDGLLEVASGRAGEAGAPRSAGTAEPARGGAQVGLRFGAPPGLERSAEGRSGSRGARRRAGDAEGDMQGMLQLGLGSDEERRADAVRAERGPSSLGSAAPELQDVLPSERGSRASAHGSGSEPGRAVDDRGQDAGPPDDDDGWWASVLEGAPGPEAWDGDRPPEVGGWGPDEGLGAEGGGQGPRLEPGSGPASEGLQRADGGPAGDDPRWAPRAAGVRAAEAGRGVGWTGPSAGMSGRGAAGRGGSGPRGSTARGRGAGASAGGLDPSAAVGPVARPAVPRGDLKGILRSAFGFEGFRPNQEAVCRAVTEGQPALLVMPTGAGKSLCYQLPGLARGGTTVVISPLIALMEDQVAKLQARGLAADRIHSGRGRDASREVCRAYLRGELDFLFLAPERLGVPGFTGMLAQRPPSLVAVDEAHCISHWGHDFRPDYRMLRERLPQLGDAPVVALTATATPQVQEDILTQLGMTRARRFIHGFRRTNIAVEVVEVPIPDRADKVAALLAEPERLPAIVYAPTRKEAEAMADALSHRVPTVLYHAGLGADVRDRAQADFLADRARVVVATIAFGMGIDKADVRTVIHTALPGSVEGYYQEIGRAGRDGAPSRAVLLHSFADRRTHQFFFERDHPDSSVLEQIFKRLSDTPLPKEALQDRLRMDPEVFAKALEKLWIHAGAQVDPEERVTRGDGGWRARYEAHRAHKQDQLERMARYAEGATCRMLQLVRHFGDRADDGATCGHCDVCAPDGGVAQAFRAPNDAELSALERILSALADRDGQAAGRLYDVLGGSYERKAFEDLLRALTRAELVRVEDETFEKDGRTIAFRRVRLTPAGHRASRSSAALLQAVRITAPEPTSGRAGGARKSTRTRGPKVAGLSPSPALLAGLKAWRLAEAKRRKVPAFRILTDRVLEHVAARSPATEQELLDVPGFGPKLLEKYGQEVLGQVRRLS
jgi:DNA topoisomerase III/RecQ family ATP-dependent DNA helicase